jgi:hypothetical protein
MARITTRQLMEAEKSGRKLTKQEQVVMAAFRKIINPLCNVMSEYLKRSDDELKPVMDSARSALDKIQKKANKPIITYEAMVYNEKKLNVKDNINEFVWDYLGNKYGDLTLGEVSNFKADTIKDDFFNWVNETEKEARQRLRIDKSASQANNKLKDYFVSENEFNICMSILEEIGVIDSSEKSILTPRTTFKLLAVIHSLKYESKKTTFFKQQYADMVLLAAFNEFLGTAIVKFNKTSKGFESTVEEVKQLINSCNS